MCKKTFLFSTAIRYFYLALTFYLLEPFAKLALRASIANKGDIFLDLACSAVKYISKRAKMISPSRNLIKTLIKLQNVILEREEGCCDMVRE